MVLYYILLPLAWLVSRTDLPLRRTIRVHDMEINSVNRSVTLGGNHLIISFSMLTPPLN